MPTRLALRSHGTWYNLIGVNDVADGLLKLYVNGVLQSTVPYTGGWQGHRQDGRRRR